MSETMSFLCILYRIRHMVERENIQSIKLESLLKDHIALYEEIIDRFEKNHENRKETE